jgi:6-phosphogluconolactonase
MSKDSLVFVSCADSGEVHVLRLNAAQGSLTTQQVLPLGGTLMPMALSPDRRTLYVARRSEPLAAVALALDKALDEVVVADESPLPASMAHLSTDATGRWLFSASYGGHLMAVQPLAADRLAGAATVHPTGENAHCAVAHPGNRWVLTASLGSGQLHRYQFDAVTGVLTPTQPPVLPMPAGTGPRHLCFNQRGNRVYLLGELDARVHVLSFDEHTGEMELLQTLPTLPEGFSGTAWGADLHISPNGRCLYTSERNSNTIAGFAMDEGSGLLALLGHWPVQAQPRGFALTEDGRYLLVAGQLSHAVGLHAVDAATGALTLLAEHAVGQNPNWVTTLTLP